MDEGVGVLVIEGEVDGEHETSFVLPAEQDCGQLQLEQTEAPAFENSPAGQMTGLMEESGQK